MVIISFVALLSPQNCFFSLICENANAQSGYRNAEVWNVGNSCELTTGGDENARKKYLLSWLPNIKTTISRSGGSTGKPQKTEKSSFETSIWLLLPSQFWEYNSIRALYGQYGINRIVFAADLGHYGKSAEIAFMPHVMSSFII